MSNSISPVMDSDTITHAAALWDYLSSFNDTAPADAIVVCCSYDLRVCDHACDLLKCGMAPRLVLSGNTGNWTRHIWTSPEAEVFLERALVCGVSRSDITLETRATNFGENIAFTRRLLPGAKSVIFTTKPASGLRVLLTAKAQWPGVDAHVSAPVIRFPEDVSNVVGILGVIDEMVGDVERIMKYPALGYQAAHEIPDEVLAHWRFLVSQGFTRHMMVSG